MHVPKSLCLSGGIKHGHTQKEKDQEINILLKISPSD
jgi:hypothetical protein